MKPGTKITTGDQCREAREQLGLSKEGLSQVLRLAANGRQTVRRIEDGKNDPSGPYQLALEALLSGWRPKGVTLPIDGAER